MDTQSIFETFFSVHPTPILLVWKDNALIWKYNQKAQSYFETPLTEFTYLNSITTEHEKILKNPLERQIIKIQSSSKEFKWTLIDCNSIIYENRELLIINFSDIDQQFNKLLSIDKQLRQIGEQNKQLSQEISEQKSIENQLAKAKEYAETNENERKQFWTNISHEIRTPLNAILGFTTLAQSQSQNNTLLNNYLTGVVQSANHLLTLFNDLLDLSRIEAGKLDIHNEVVNPYEVIEEMRDMFAQIAAQKQLVFNIQTDSQLPASLILDHRRIRQILFNLVGNAIKFTELGSVTVSVNSENKDAEGSLIDFFFEVRDTGSGIAPEKIENIFKPFRNISSSSYQQGSIGLGLPLVKRLVEMIGGTIVIESVEGIGSIFSVHLTNIPVAILNKGDHKIPENITDYLKGVKILIVEDVEANRLILKNYLSKFGVEVLESDNGKEALKLVELSMPDIIIMDENMPIMQGGQAAQVLRKHQHSQIQKIPLIALSAESNDNEQHIDNFCDYKLQKPVSLRKLLGAIIDLLPHKTINGTPNYYQELNIESEFSVQTTEIDLVELKKEIETHLLPFYHQVMESHFFDEITKFAQQVTQAGMTHKAPPLFKYGRQLVDYCNNFDIDKINQYLPHFLDIIKQF